jgi:hypothetical protein
MTRQNEWAREQRKDPEGRQVHCLVADEGHLWIHYLDDLHPAVRQRLAESPFNICPACLVIFEVPKVAKRLKKAPTVGLFCAVIDQIEQELRTAKAIGD